jgi:hypothetical protein
MQVFLNPSVNFLSKNFFITDLLFLVVQHLTKQPYRKDLIIHHIVALACHHYVGKYAPSLWITACISEVLTCFTGLASLSDWHQNNKLSKIIIGLRLLSIILIRMPMWFWILYVTIYKKVIKKFGLAIFFGLLFISLDSYWLYLGIKKLI